MQYKTTQDNTVESKLLHSTQIKFNAAIYHEDNDYHLWLEEQWFVRI